MTPHTTLSILPASKRAITEVRADEGVVGVLGHDGVVVPRYFPHLR